MPPPGGGGPKIHLVDYVKHVMTSGQGQKPRDPLKYGKIKVAFLLGKSALQNWNFCFETCLDTF